MDNNNHRIELKSRINVQAIDEIINMEFTKNQTCEIKPKNCWSIYYVDKGILEVDTSKNIYQLKQSDAVFIKPGEPCTLNLFNVPPPSVFMLSFETNDSYMGFFNNRFFSFEIPEQEIMHKIISEIKVITPANQIKKNNDFLNYGTDQIIKILIEQLLLTLRRRFYMKILNSCDLSMLDNDNFLLAWEKKMLSIRYQQPTNAVITRNYKYKLLSKYKNRAEDELVTKIIEFLYSNIYSTLTIDDICENFHYRKTYLCEKFKKKTGKTIIGYFIEIKINEAKQLIRQGDLNYTQISEKLGFSTIHYFSYIFKKITGMTPSQYAALSN